MLNWLRCVMLRIGKALWEPAYPATGDEGELAERDAMGRNW